MITHFPSIFVETIVYVTTYVPFIGEFHYRRAIKYIGYTKLTLGPFVKLSPTVYYA